LSDAELDRITTATTLTLGSLQTDRVFIDGVSHVDTPSDVYVLSMNSVAFLGSASSFSTRVGVHADNDIDISTNVNVT